MFSAIWKLLDGHKTNLIAGFLFVLAILILNGINIPSWLLLIVGSAGMVAIRDAINKTDKKR